MSTFGIIKAGLRGIINRKDLTDALAGDFINRAIIEVERVCRIGALEQLLQTAKWDGTENSLAIPQGYLETIDLFTDEGTLLLVSKDQYFSQPATGKPSVYIKAGASFLLRPAPAAGTPVYLHYYGGTLPLQADTDENLWTRSGFNAVLYGAASLAADYFQMEDPYVQRFQDKANGFVQGILTQDATEKWSVAANVGRTNFLGDY